MPPPREVELKLELDPLMPARRVRRSLGRMAAIGGEGETRRLVSTIYDTHDHALRKSGLVLRIRRDGRRRIQTLKAEIANGSLERAEWECEVEGDAPDLAAIADADLRRDIEAAGPLSAVLETEFDRTIWQVRHQGSDVELALDEGAIRTKAGSIPISEIELELNAGVPTALFGLAREIVDLVPARPGLRSKSERGYDLLRRGGVKAEAVRVESGMNVAAAFQVISRGCLRQYLTNEPGIRARDAEALHRGRVAIRRLRSCLKLHKALIADSEGERLRVGLRRLFRDLGIARTLDVYLAGQGGMPATSESVAGAAAERELAYDRLIAKLRSKRVRVLLLDMMAYAETGPWLRDPDRRDLRNMKVETFAATTLRKRWHRLCKNGRDLASQSPAVRHEVRIDGKVLRYAAEFFAGAFPGRKSKRRRQALLEGLSALQTHLGDLNDIEAASSLAALHGEGTATEDDLRLIELLSEAQAAHAEIESAKPFWS